MLVINNNTSFTVAIHKIHRGNVQSTVNEKSAFTFSFFVKAKTYLTTEIFFYSYYQCITKSTLTFK